VSNGVFYRYYRNKEALFSSLLEEFLERFAEDLRTVTGTTLSERLYSLIVTVTGAAPRYSGQVSMFREGQYRNPVYEQRLRALYIDTLERVYKRKVSEVEYLYLMSGLRFLATRSLYDQKSWDVELLADVLTHGVFPSAEEQIELSTIPENDTPTPHSTEQRLMEAGMSLFGQRGFHGVQVADIVREAGLSVGTFYNCFESKESFLAEIVKAIGQRTRRYLSTHLPQGVSRWELEVRGIWSFLGYFGRHLEYYEIVRGAEFVRPAAVRDYYDEFEEGDCRNLVAFPAQQRHVIANFLMGLSHYLGIEVFFSKGVADAAASVRALGALLAHGVPE
jgi:AcrR family transcriptional regulator